LLAQYFQKHPGTNRYARSMNWGEFIHFSSGAAGKNMKNQATIAFGWTTKTCGNFLRKDDWDIPGNDMLPSPVQLSDYTSCCIRCQTTLGCKAFAYSPSTKQCWPKTSTGDGGKPEGDRISGYSPNVCGGFIRKDDWDIPGNDLLPSSVQVSDYAGCCVKCQTTSGCNAFAYSPSTKECWPKTSIGGIVGATWKEHWFDHNQLLTRVYYGSDLALYYDSDVDRSTIPYISKYLSDAWRYVKRNYGSFGPDERLYAIFHTGKYGGGHPSYYYSASHDFKNVIDQGAGPWFEDLGSMDIPTHEIFHIVEMASFNTQGSPGFGNPPNGIWGDSKMAEIFGYDLYKGLGLMVEAERAKILSLANSDNFPRPNTYWFRDWLFPWYTQGGETRALVNFFRLLAQYFPKHPGTNRYARSMNWGEFIHFSSGAAEYNSDIFLLVDTNPKSAKILLLELSNLQIKELKLIVQSCTSDKCIELASILPDISFDTLYVLNNGEKINETFGSWWNKTTVVYTEKQLMRHLCTKSMLCYYNEGLQHQKNGDMGLSNACMIDSLRALDYSAKFI
ncbi:unnamed protein product, partial [Rotaria sordida]